MVTYNWDYHVKSYVYVKRWANYTNSLGEHLYKVKINRRGRVYQAVKNMHLIPSTVIKTDERTLYVFAESTKHARLLGMYTVSRSRWLKQTMLENPLYNGR